MNWHPLHAFMDVFQGCYKNGTDGTRDCRYFAALNLVLRMLILFPIGDNSMHFGVRLTLVLTVFILMWAIIRPYQRNFFNNLEIFISCSVVVVAIWVLWSFFSEHRLFAVFYAPFLYLAYFFILFGAKFLRTFAPRCYSVLVEKIKTFVEKTSFPCCCYRQEARRISLMERGDVSLSEEVDEEYPDRVNNPQDYEPLLAPHRQDLAGNQTSAVLTYGITASACTG